MAHEIIFDEVRGINPIAFVGEVPWHGLGQQLTPNSPLEVWAEQAGMDWNINSSPVSFTAAGAGSRTRSYFQGRKVLYRNDDLSPLSIVSDQYKEVQPREVLEFFRDLTEVGGFRLNTAGVLHGGKKFWALAETGEEARIMGQDKLNNFLLLATACDGSLATTAMFTSVRVVCNNTLTCAVERDGAVPSQYLKIPHSRTFNPDEIKAELGLAHNSWGKFVEEANVLAHRKVSDREALIWMAKVLAGVSSEDKGSNEFIAAVDQSGKIRSVKACLELFQGKGKGSNLRSADGTVWGMVNAVTEYMDHHRPTRTTDSRLDGSWFGEQANIKQRAWNEALKLAA